MGELVDRYGRRMRKLRISLLDACNFRCLYCMPENQTFMTRSRWLAADEILRIAEILVGFGLEQIRVTGGEPTLRPEFREILSRISELPIKKLGMTTNGYSLRGLLPFLRETRCRHINISLDSLNADKFSRITRTRHFDEVIAGIESAREMGFEVKINAVLMRGVNDDEVFDFVAFSERMGIEVRFLELMKIGEARRLGAGAFVPADEVIGRILTRVPLKPERVDPDSTSFNYSTETGARIGFIASESRPFCQSCSRLRLSAEGVLRACLMAENGIPLKGLSSDGIHRALLESLERKPNFRVPETPVTMNQLGG